MRNTENSHPNKPKFITPFGLKPTSPCPFSAVQGPVWKPMPPVNREQQDKGQHFIPTQLLQGAWAMRQLLSLAVYFKKSEEEVYCSSPRPLSGHVVSLALCFCTSLFSRRQAASQSLPSAAGTGGQCPPALSTSPLPHQHPQPLFAAETELHTPGAAKYAWYKLLSHSFKYLLNRKLLLESWALFCI